MLSLVPQPKNIISDVIDEEAKFMKSGTSQVHADSLEVNVPQQPHIIESDNFFQLPSQEGLNEARQQSENIE